MKHSSPEVIEKALISEEGSIHPGIGALCIQVGDGLLEESVLLDVLVVVVLGGAEEDEEDKDVDDAVDVLMVEVG